MASCFVLLRQRWANLGTAATDVDGCSRGLVGVVSTSSAIAASGSTVVEARAVFKLRVVMLGEKELTWLLPPRAAKRAMALKQAGEIFMVF